MWSLHEQMEIEDYDKPLRSPVSRSSSSTSLKDQLSPDLISDVRIYHKMNPSVRQHHRQSHRSKGRASDAAIRYVYTSYCINRVAEISRPCVFAKLWFVGPTCINNFAHQTPNDIYIHKRVRCLVTVRYMQYFADCQPVNKDPHHLSPEFLCWK